MNPYIHSDDDFVICENVDNRDPIIDEELINEK